MFSNLFGRNSNSPSVIRSDAEVNPVEAGDNLNVNGSFKGLNDSQEDCEHETESGYNTETEEIEVGQESEAQDLSFESECEIVNLDECKESADYPQSPKTVSYALKPLLYTAKYGAKALSATAIVGSYTLSGTSYIIAGTSYVPHGVSRTLEEIKEKDKNTAGYKVITASQNLLDLTSGAMYAVSYVPYGAGVVLNGVSSIANQLDTSLSPEKIEQICTKSDLFIEDLSSKLKGVTENSIETMSKFSNVLLTRTEKQNSIYESDSKSNKLECATSVKRQKRFDLYVKKLVEQMVNTRKKFSELEINDELKAQVNSKLEKRNETLRDLNEKYKKEFGNYNTKLTEFLSSELLESKKLLESGKSDVSKLDVPSTGLSILSNISRIFSAPFSYLASGN